MRELERVVLLKNVDSKWMDHIDAMAELRNGIGCVHTLSTIRLSSTSAKASICSTR